MPEAAGVTAALVGFARLLRKRGLRPSPAEVSRFQAAIGALRSGGLRDLYWAGRICLGVPASSAAIYDAAFAEYFLGVPARTPEGAEAGRLARPVYDNGQPDAAAAAAAEEGGGQGKRATGYERAGRAASVLEVLRATPFAACTPEEQDIVIALIRRICRQPPDIPGRRMTPGRRKEAFDLRATARLARKTQADLLTPAWRHRKLRPRRVVVLIDVSASMAPYPRLYLHFGYALATARTGVEVVCFGTRLTRITGLLRSRQPARVLEQAAMSVLDWNGGTRIADAVRGLRAMPGVRAVLRRAIVIICSDGLEQGNPDDLGQQMYLLSRNCDEVIWVNPLAGDDRYQPIAGGMKMALPWVHRLVPGDTVAALEQVAAALGNGPLPRGRCRRPVQPPARATSLT
jgi:uncharacterized protein with von Willebrand factor type A (vWA) domain